MNVLKKFALMFCGSSIGLGAVLGAVFIRSFLVGAGSGDLLMAPLLHDFSNRLTLEGQVLRFECEIWNGGSDAIMDVRLPCGCIALEDEVGGRIDGEVALAPKQSTKIRGSFDTEGKRGLVQYEIPVVFKSRQFAILKRTKLVVSARVSSGMTACPSNVQLSKMKPDAIIHLCDSLDIPSEQVLDVTCSLKNVDVSWIAGEGEYSFGGWKMNKRATISVSSSDFKATSSIQHGQIEISLKAIEPSRAKRELLVPISIDSDVIRISPDKLTFNLDEASQGSQSISVYRSDRTLDVAVISLPDFCSISLARKVGGFDFFELTASEGSGAIVFEVGSERMEIPIFVSRDKD
jgi:hypothetical protein